MPDADRLARALADEMRFTTSPALQALIVNAARGLEPFRRHPALHPEILLGRDLEWRALIERALEVSDA